MDDCAKFAQPESETSLLTSCLCICLVLCTITAVTFFALFVYNVHQQPYQQLPLQQPPEQKDDCAAICASNKNCKGYVYDSIAKTCLLKME